MFGIPKYYSTCIVTMCVSALAMTTIDAVTRIGRMMLQEILAPEEGKEQGSVAKFLSNTYVATIVTLIPKLPAVPGRLHEHLAAVSVLPTSCSVLCAWLPWQYS